MKFSEMSKEEIKEMMEGKKMGSGRSKKGGGRKEELFSILKEGIYSVEELSEKMGISRRNVSSLLTYIRDDGFILKEMGERKVLWSKIVGGVKVKNRIELGKGKEVRFNFEKMKFDDEK